MFSAFLPCRHPFTKITALFSIIHNYCFTHFSPLSCTSFFLLTPPFPPGYFHLHADTCMPFLHSYLLVDCFTTHLPRSLIFFFTGLSLHSLTRIVASWLQRYRMSLYLDVSCFRNVPSVYFLYICVVVVMPL